MAFPVVQSRTAYSTASDTTTWQITLPAVINSGDLLLCFFGTHPRQTHTTPTGWTLVGTSHSSAGRMSVFGKDADGTEDSTTLNLYTSASFEAAAAHVYVISGTNGVASVDITTDETLVYSSRQHPSVTASGGADDNLFIFAHNVNDDDADISSWATELATNGLHTLTGGGNNQSTAVGSSYYTSAGATEQPGFTTLDASERWQMVSLAIAPSATTGYTFTAEQGSFTLTGQDASFWLGEVLAAENGSFTLTGQDTEFLYGYSINAGQGLFTLNGQSTDFNRTYIRESDSGTFSLTGNDASFILGATTERLYVVVYDSALAEPSASQIVAGNDVNNNPATYAENKPVSVTSVVSFSATGLAEDTSYKASFVWDNGVVSNVVTTDAFVTRTLAAESASFTLTGQDVGFTITQPGSYNLQAFFTAFDVTGQSSNLLYNPLVSADQGTFILTGQDAVLEYVPSGTLDADTGIFTLSGQDVDLDYSGFTPWQQIPPDSTTWIKIDPDGSIWTKVT